MASLIPIGASIVGGIFNKKSKDKEAQGIQQATDEANARLEPFRQSGVAANDVVGGALGLGGTAGSDNAFKNFLNSTGYKSQLQAGSDAIVNNNATRGLLNSGSTLKRQTKFGQDLAQQGFSNFLGNLNTMANRGANAAVGNAANTQRGGIAAAGTRSMGSEALQEGIGQGVKLATPVVKNFFGSL